MAALKNQIILGYQEFFGELPPDNRLSIIQHVSRRNLLFEIAGLNYRLKPNNKYFTDRSLETQKKELLYFTAIDARLHAKYSVVANWPNEGNKDYPIIFNRMACVYALEEILNSTEIVEIDDFKMASIENWEAILKYLLAVNTTITMFKEEANIQKVNIESVNPKLIVLNELAVETDQILTPYRGYHLLKYIVERTIYGAQLKAYLASEFQLEFDHFIFHILSLCLANKTNISDHSFHYSVKQDDLGLFQVLSKRIVNAETEKLIGIRKYPFINVGERKYLLSDITFLVDKSYSQLINDFWFDHLKSHPEEKFDYRHYKGTIGYFFESFAGDLLRSILSQYRFSKLLMFDELKIATGKGPIEIADIYFRYSNRVLIGQAKAGLVYDNAKYGRDIQSLYKNDRNSFFLNFGVNQLVDSIGNLIMYIRQLDGNFPAGHTIHIYPCILVQDKALQTPLMAQVFNLRFQELLENTGFSKKNRIKHLNVIHISDLEVLEDRLTKSPQILWELLEQNKLKKNFIPPFYHTAHKYLNGAGYSKKVIELFHSLIKKFNPNEQTLS